MSKTDNKHICVELVLFTDEQWYWCSERDTVMDKTVEVTKGLGAVYTPEVSIVKCIGIIASTIDHFITAYKGDVSGRYVRLTSNDILFMHEDMARMMCTSSGHAALRVYWAQIQHLIDHNLINQYVVAYRCYKEGL